MAESNKNGIFQGNVKVGAKALILGVSGDFKIRNPNIETRKSLISIPFQC